MHRTIRIQATQDVWDKSGDAADLSAIQPYVDKLYVHKRPLFPNMLEAKLHGASHKCDGGNEQGQAAHFCAGDDLVTNKSFQDALMLPVARHGCWQTRVL